MVLSTALTLIAGLCLLIEYATSGFNKKNFTEKVVHLEREVLVAPHEGGISLYNLKQQLLVRSFELIIPPGAIGGNSNPNDPSVFEERCPSVNCICFRPDGLVFVAGYSDGCMAFWSIDDGELPILVRTIDRGNVFTFDWPDPQDDPTLDVPPLEGQRGREPIFKIAWSHSPTVRHDNLDQEHSDNDDTKLIVLGGLLESDSIGLHVFHLPAYHPNSKSTDGLSTESRGALKESLSTAKHSVYLTAEVPDDFLLIPRKSPYFDNAEDPRAILISTTCSHRHDWFDFAQLSSGNNPHFSSRTLHAYAFPPHLEEQPPEYQLPASFDWIGSKSVVNSQIFDLSDIAYHSLQSSSKQKTSTQSQPKDLLLRGGQARASPLIMAALEENFQNASRLITEFSQKHRILITIHLDYKIRFWDFSLDLLLPRKRHTDAAGERAMAYDFELHSEFPRRLDHLTIDMASLLRPPLSINTHLNFNKLTLPIDLQLNPESLDLIVMLADKGCLLYQFHGQHIVSPEEPIDHSTIVDNNLSTTSLSLPNDLNQPANCSSESSNRASICPSIKFEEDAVDPSRESDVLIDLMKFQKSSPSSTGFLPTALINVPGQGAINSTTIGSQVGDQDEILYALEDIGFLAIANPKEDWIRIADLRKFKLLFDDAIRDESKARGKSKENRIHCISWILARTESDSTVLPRLLIGLSNGSFNMINLIPSDLDSVDNWTAVLVPGDCIKPDHHHKSGNSSNHPVAAFTFDPDGSPLLANLTSLRNAISQSSRSQMVFTEEDPDSSETCLDSVLILVFSHSVMLRVNVNGPQLLNRTGLSSQPFVHASIISYYSSHALLLIDVKRNCHILTLPKLEVIFRSALPISDRGDDNVGKLCVDRSGDILEHFGLSTTQLTTLIYGRDAIHFPEMQVYDGSISTPDPPKANEEGLRLSMMTSSLALNLASWFNPNLPSNVGTRPGGGTKVTGVEIDSILAGPQRPSGKKVTPQPPRGRQKRPTGFIKRTTTPHDTSRERALSGDKFGEASGTAKTQLNHNVEALDERADRLAQLNERFDDLAVSSKSLVQEAKRLASQQAAKSAFSGGLSNVKSLFK